MSDSLYNLHTALRTRPVDMTVGWRRGVAVSNAEFLRRIANWRITLQAQAGNNLALYIEDSIEFSAALIGAWCAGKTVWLCADTLAASVASLRKQVDLFAGEFPAECAPLSCMWDAVDADTEDFVFAPDFPALIVHTSGTTGEPQAIRKRLSQMASEVATLEVAFGSQLGDCAIAATVSHHHIYGLLFRVLWPLAAGRPMYAHAQNFPEELAQVMAQRPCALIASPAHLKRLPDHLDWSAAITSLRAIFSSGGPLPPDVAQATASMLGHVPIEVYGSSETGGVAWRQRIRPEDETWRALPDVAWRIADEDDLLEVRSPHLPDDSWLRVADRAQAVDAERFLLNGRGDRIVKIEEKRISLDAIEAALTASSLVEAVRVLVCDPELGQRQQLAAFVALSEVGQQALRGDGKLALNRSLRNLLADHVEAVGIPRRWRYLDELPVNAQGKTTRAMLLALLDARPREPQIEEIERNVDAQQVKLQLTIPADLFYFDGHFDQAPILPGVVQVDWAISIGRRYFDLPPVFRAVNMLKFQQVIRPEQVVTLELNYDVAKETLGFRYTSSAGPHASGRVVFSHQQQE
jgi:acyl-coenzyme A synthetase/AMP-(fatty) acid ligase/3-hydroxymyristoyl/3-hydroxydecanoyl-(acyl carrier protein) dehydratase